MDKAQQDLTKSDIFILIIKLQKNIQKRSPTAPRSPKESKIIIYNNDIRIQRKIDSILIFILFI